MTQRTLVHEAHGHQVYDCYGDGATWWEIESVEGKQMIRKDGPAFYLLHALLSPAVKLATENALAGRG